MLILIAFSQPVENKGNYGDPENVLQIAANIAVLDFSAKRFRKVKQFTNYAIVAEPENFRDALRVALAFGQNQLIWQVLWR
jgi:hypothetical protein